MKKSIDKNPKDNYATARFGKFVEKKVNDYINIELRNKR